ncbi:MAG: SAM-dependent methyltransferase [Campylobacter sp.]|nr:SAM-dependent methyltransferase [Campylobacter sp.]
MGQTHLNRTQTINLGSYYTPKFIVNIAYDMLEKYVNLSDFKLLDSSCGYGDFFIKDLDYIGADIDEGALKKVSSKARIFQTNSLLNLSREKFALSQNDKLVIIGNPPYNDKELYAVDKNLMHRDLGISFMRSYEVLKPEFICVLHPLSYLIKRTNFASLAKFKDNYRLIDGVVISSEIFTPASSTFFPILEILKSIIYKSPS